ncbi:MAG TPA: lipase maturation factor family protein, partial [Thermoanaerobaculia bacterium]|nr:lipase maturation factor family protein [Thermoanaerobaculia bacterium]
VLFLGVLLLDDRDLRLKAPAGSPAPHRAPIAVVIILCVFFFTSIAIFFVPRAASIVEPFRIVNNYGLFAIMTRARYEIEFQGSSDLVHWTPYPFRYKPQDVRERPGLYAPYQPRFDWNLWFASLGTIEENRWIMNTEVRLLENSEPVLRLFSSNPFPHPPSAVRVVMWQYWFSSREEKERSGVWWDRKFLGPYAPTAVRRSDGSIGFE